jgi:cytochrome c biogenesis protein CcmG/thiol:disulfide interchange protein DsbE
MRIRRIMLLPILLAAACARPAVVEPGLPVPDYAMQQLDGRTVELAELRGKVVLLNVWATWCWPCRREMPGLEALHRDMADRGLHVLAVSIDSRGAVEDIRAFLDELDLTLPVLHDPERVIERRFATIGVPETFLIGADGLLRQRWRGRIDPRSPVIHNAVQQALLEIDRIIHHARDVRTTVAASAALAADRAAGSTVPDAAQAVPASLRTAEPVRRFKAESARRAEPVRHLPTADHREQHHRET